MINGKIVNFCVVTGLFWLSMYAYMPTLAAYSRWLGASYEFVGLIIGAYGFTQMLLRIPIGILSDTLNRRCVFITTGLVVSVGSSLLVWLVPSVWTLLVGRALAGAAASTWVIYTVLFSSYFSQADTSRAIGLITAVNSAGQVTGLFLGGLAAEKFGQHITFLLAASAAGVGIFLSLRITEPLTVAARGIRWQSVVKTAKDHTLLLMSGLAIIIQLLLHGTVFGFTPLAAKQLGASDFGLGLLTTMSILPGVFASALSGSWFSQRYGERRTIIGGFSVTAASCLAIPWCSSLPLLYLSQIVGGFGRGLVLPLLMSLSIKNTAQRQRATAMGFFQAIYGLGMFLGPVIVSLLGERAGLDWGFGAIGCLGLLGAVLALHISERQDKKVTG